MRLCPITAEPRHYIRPGLLLVVAFTVLVIFAKIRWQKFAPWQRGVISAGAGLSAATAIGLFLRANQIPTPPYRTMFNRLVPILMGMDDLWISLDSFPRILKFSIDPTFSTLTISDEQNHNASINKDATAEETDGDILGFVSDNLELILFYCRPGEHKDVGEKIINAAKEVISKGKNVEGFTKHGDRLVANRLGVFRQEFYLEGNQLVISSTSDDQNENHQKIYVSSLDGLTFSYNDTNVKCLGPSLRSNDPIEFSPSDDSLICTNALFGLLSIAMAGGWNFSV